MSLENLKVSKQIISAMTEIGYLHPTEMQAKAVSRINGGQNIVGIAPEGCGKTTTIVISVLNKLKFPQEGAPRALIIVANKEKVLEMTEHFKWLGKHSGIRVATFAPSLGSESSTEAIEDGTADVVIGTPDKINNLYNRAKLNLRKMMLFIVDDSETIIKQGQQSLLYQVNDGMPKCQRLFFSEVMHEKFLRMVELCIPYYETVEVEGIEETGFASINQVLYRVPNYKTKLNLINLMMQDEEEFQKVVIFTNTRQTSESVFKSLKKRIGSAAGILNHPLLREKSFNTFEEFKTSEEARVMVVSHQDQPSFNLLEIQYVLHFDVPEDKEIFLDRVKKITDNEEEQALGITFATNSELIIVKKIEQVLGYTIQEEELPLGLVIEGNRKRKVNIEEEMSGKAPEGGGAFHEKKASNAKGYNWGWKVKNQLFGKKYKTKNKK